MSVATGGSGEPTVPAWLRGLPRAPEHRPTESEFADPIAFLSRVEREAAAYGICKVIPPYPRPSHRFVFAHLNRSLVSSSEAASTAPLQASNCRRRRRAVPAQQTRRLWSMVPADKAAEAGSDKAPQIDVTQFGYFKVLAKGVLPPKPIVVKRKLISKVAKKKIKAAGGAVVLTA